jgi:glycosyltransferase involved in cell wall biosynthesis
VDVIVPCYRYGRFLRECVESVLTQSLRDVRVLIIDDASPDNTPEVAADLAARDSRVTFVRHVVNKGHIATYNEGIDWASADYMLLLSADDYLLPGALSRAVALMEAHPEVGFSFGKVIELRGNEGKLNLPNTIDCGREPGWHILTGPEFIERNGKSNIVSTPTALVRTDLQKRLGGYRLDLPHSGDMEMWLRFAAHSLVGRLEAYQAVYRCHSHNMSLAYTRESWLPDLQQRKAAFDCLFDAYSCILRNSTQLRCKVLKSLACCAVGLASEAFNGGQMDSCDSLTAFALEIRPEIRRSWPWLKLACKRRLGLRAWKAVRPIVASIRVATLR